MRGADVVYPAYMTPDTACVRNALPFDRWDPKAMPSLAAMEHRIMQEEENSLIFADAVYVSPFVALLMCPTNEAIPVIASSVALFQGLWRVLFLLLNSENPDCPDWEQRIRFVSESIAVERNDLCKRLITRLRVDPVFERVKHEIRERINQSPTGRLTRESSPLGKDDTKLRYKAQRLRNYTHQHTVTVLRRLELCMAYLLGLNTSTMPDLLSANDPFTSYAIPSTQEIERDQAVSQRLAQGVMNHVIHRFGPRVVAAGADEKTPATTNSDDCVLDANEIKIAASHPNCMDGATCVSYMGAWLRTLELH